MRLNRPGKKTATGGREAGSPPVRRRWEIPGRTRTAKLLFSALVIFLATAVTATLVVVGVALSTPGRLAVPELPEPSVPPNAEPDPVLPAYDDSAPAPTESGLAAALGPALADPALGTSVAARVVDPADGSVLFDQNGAAALTPASSAKVLTALAASATIEPGHRLTTSVVAGAQPGQVVLVGGGDPTLSTRPESPAYPGAATIAELAAEVQAAADGPVTSVLVDSSRYTGPTTAPGWAPGDAPSTYAAPIAPVMVDGGRLDPNGAARSATPDLDAGKALAAALGVPATAVSGGEAPPDAPELGDVRSAPIERLIEQMLTLSDNVLAECVARELALATGAEPSFQGSAQAIRDALAELGVDLTGVSLVDGSGLSTMDTVSADALTSALALAAAPDTDVPNADVVLSGLPVAGYDGTLDDRYADAASEPAAGIVRAKTGTLDGTNTLTGVLRTADGRLLVFAFMANGVPVGGIEAAEAALDHAAAVLAACGCR